MKKFRNIALLSIVFLLMSLHLGASEKPNIIYILVDDLGYGDVNFNIPELDRFNNPSIKTPNLEKLAKRGAVFTDHYSSSPVCSPSRAGLLTGRTPTRCNINRWIKDLNFDGEEFLKDEEITIAEICKEAGYETAIFGKWHLNCADWTNPENWKAEQGTFPNQQGFDAGIITKENPHLTCIMESNSQKNPGDFYTIDGNPLGTIKGYSSEIITDSALFWLKHHQPENPFFLYLPYDAVHERIYNPDKYDYLYNTGNPNKDVYYANVTYLDHQIGRLLDGIEKLGLLENSVLFFSSDNGPERLYYHSYRSYGTSYPLHGQKRQLYEGGIRMPGIVCWPGKIEPRISNEPNSTLDVLPTICEILGVQPPADRSIDGTSILSHLLKNQSIQRNKPLYWQYEYPEDWVLIGEGYNKRYDGFQKLKNVPLPSVSIRSGNYVLRGLFNGRFVQPEKYVLYDVVNDPEETNELSTIKPEVFNRMKSELEKMYQNVNEERLSGGVVKIRN